MRWQLQRRVHELLSPSQAAHGAVFTRELLLLQISDGSETGWGEAAPIASYNGITLDEVDSQLRKALSLLAGQDPDDPDATLRLLEGGLSMPSRAALEVALRDLAARRRGISLLEAFGISTPQPIELRALLTATSVAEAGAEAARAADAGYTALKAKVGHSVELDLVRLIEIRTSVEASVHLSADANGAYSYRTAEDFLERAEGIVNLVEQPVSGIEQMRQLHRTSTIPIALDEDATEQDALRPPLSATTVCLKLQAWGGIDRMVAAAHQAHQAGLTVTYGSTLEGPVGIAASLIAAQVAPADLPSGLGTLALFQESFPGLKARDGMLTSPSGNGIGIVPDGTEC